MTSEHAYQAMKFLDPALQQRVWEQETPKKAATIGRDPTLPLRPDWEKPDSIPDPPAIVKVKDRFMYEIVLAKFRQNKDLGQRLMDSGDAYLVEDTYRTGDAYWGETSPGVGENRLGHILMKVREQLREDKRRMDACTELTRISEELGLYDLESKLFVKS
jgi:ribA/ribD-fused uncharacterized protein